MLHICLLKEHWKAPIRLLFIDANHEYSAVKKDFEGWQKHVAKGGLIAFHDVDRWNSSLKELDGPTKVVYEDVKKTGLYSTPVIVNHLAYVTRLYFNSDLG